MEDKSCKTHFLPDPLHWLDRDSPGSIDEANLVPRILPEQSERVLTREILLGEDKKPPTALDTILESLLKMISDSISDIVQERDIHHLKSLSSKLTEIVSSKSSSLVDYKTRDNLTDLVTKLLDIAEKSKHNVDLCCVMTSLAIRITMITGRMSVYLDLLTKLLKNGFIDDKYIPLVNFRNIIKDFKYLVIEEQPVEKINLNIGGYFNLPAFRNNCYLVFDQTRILVEQDKKCVMYSRATSPNSQGTSDPVFIHAFDKENKNYFYSCGNMWVNRYSEIGPVGYKGRSYNRFWYFSAQSGDNIHSSYADPLLKAAQGKYSFKTSTFAGLDNRNYYLLSMLASTDKASESKITGLTKYELGSRRYDYKNIISQIGVSENGSLVQTWIPSESEANLSNIGNCLIWHNKANEFWLIDPESGELLQRGKVDESIHGVDHPRRLVACFKDSIVTMKKADLFTEHVDLISQTAVVEKNVSAKKTGAEILGLLDKDTSFEEIEEYEFEDDTDEAATKQDNETIVDNDKGVKSSTDNKAASVHETPSSSKAHATNLASLLNYLCASLFSAPRLLNIESLSKKDASEFLTSHNGPEVIPAFFKSLLAYLKELKKSKCLQAEHENSLWSSAIYILGVHLKRLHLVQGPTERIRLYNPQVLQEITDIVAEVEKGKDRAYCLIMLSLLGMNVPIKLLIDQLVNQKDRIWDADLVVSVCKQILPYAESNERKIEVLLEITEQLDKALDIEGENIVGLLGTEIDKPPEFLQSKLLSQNIKPIISYIISQLSSFPQEVIEKLVSAILPSMEKVCGKLLQLMTKVKGNSNWDANIYSEFSSYMSSTTFSHIYMLLSQLPSEVSEQLGRFDCLMLSSLNLMMFQLYESYKLDFSMDIDTSNFTSINGMYCFAFRLHQPRTKTWKFDCKNSMHLIINGGKYESHNKWQIESPTVEGFIICPTSCNPKYALNIKCENRPKEGHYRNIFTRILNNIERRMLPGCRDKIRELEHEDYRTLMLIGRTGIKLREGLDETYWSEMNKIASDKLDSKEDIRLALQEALERLSLLPKEDTDISSNTARVLEFIQSEHSSAKQHWKQALILKEIDESCISQVSLNQIIHFLCWTPLAIESAYTLEKSIMNSTRPLLSLLSQQQTAMKDNPYYLGDIVCRFFTDSPSTSKFLTSSHLWILPQTLVKEFNQPLSQLFADLHTYANSKATQYDDYCEGDFRLKVKAWSKLKWMAENFEEDVQINSSKMTNYLNYLESYGDVVSASISIKAARRGGWNLLWDKINHLDIQEPRCYQEVAPYAVRQAWSSMSRDTKSTQQYQSVVLQVNENLIPKILEKSTKVSYNEQVTSGILTCLSRERERRSESTEQMMKEKEGFISKLLDIAVKKYDNLALEELNSLKIVEKMLHVAKTETIERLNKDYLKQLVKKQQQLAYSKGELSDVINRVIKLLSGESIVNTSSESKKDSAYTPSERHNILSIKLYTSLGVPKGASRVDNSDDIVLKPSIAKDRVVDPHSLIVKGLVKDSLLNLRKNLPDGCRHILELKEDKSIPVLDLSNYSSWIAITPWNDFHIDKPSKKALVRLLPGDNNDGSSISMPTLANFVLQNPGRNVLQTSSPIKYTVEVIDQQKEEPEISPVTMNIIFVPCPDNIPSNELAKLSNAMDVIIRRDCRSLEDKLEQTTSSFKEKMEPKFIQLSKYVSEWRKELWAKNKDKRKKEDAINLSSCLGLSEEDLLLYLVSLTGRLDKDKKRGAMNLKDTFEDKASIVKSRIKETTETSILGRQPNVVQAFYKSLDNPKERLLHVLRGTEATPELIESLYKIGCLLGLCLLVDTSINFNFAPTLYKRLLNDEVDWSDFRESHLSMVLYFERLQKLKESELEDLKLPTFGLSLKGNPKYFESFSNSEIFITGHNIGRYCTEFQSQILNNHLALLDSIAEGFRSYVDKNNIEQETQHTLQNCLEQHPEVSHPHYASAAHHRILPAFIRQSRSFLDHLESRFYKNQNDHFVANLLCISTQSEVPPVPKPRVHRPPTPHPEKVPEVVDESESVSLGGLFD